MKHAITPVLILGFLALVLSATAQTATTSLPSNLASIQVPPVIQFSSVAIDEIGSPSIGPVEITFSFYNNSQGGTPLWSETQNVSLDGSGHYNVYLGITKTNGLPPTLFTSGEAHWLGVKIANQPEQPRVFLVSVPYAMKAGDAATVGGLPPSAFIMATPGAGPASPSSSSASGGGNFPNIGGLGTQNYIPLWTDNSGDLGDSVMFQLGSGSTAMIGINTTTPTTTLDVHGAGTIRGNFALPSIGTATATVGKNSQPFEQIASAFNSSSGKSVSQAFLWQAEPVGNDTSTPSAALHLLFGSGTGAPVETGLNLASNGQFTFAPGQTFPGAGTITGVTAGTGLSGGGNSGNITLGLASNACVAGSAVSALPFTCSPFATLGANAFSGNQTVNGNEAATNITATSTVAGNVVNATTSFDFEGMPFGFGSIANQNAFLGFAGSSSTTQVEYDTAIGYAALAFDNGSGSNTAIGASALYNNTSGRFNTATGVDALQTNTAGEFNTAAGVTALALNTIGNSNTAIGDSALYFNTTGDNNTASGVQALLGNTTGGSNVASGYNSLYQNTTGSYNVAIGASALYDVSTGMANTGIGNAAGQTADGSVLTGKNNTALGTGAKFGTGSLTNASAIGANAEVTESNTMVLGSVNGVNGQTVSINVGIGTTSPDTLLSVNGNADKPGGGSWGTFSDRRLKTLDGNFIAGLSQVLKINPVRYRYKQDNGMGIHDQEEHVGLVAQDVQKVIPEAVTENGKGYLLVNNDPIIWTMLNAIKEQQTLIRKQEAQIAHLMSQVKAIRASLKPDGRNGLEVRSVKAQVALVHP